MRSTANIYSLPVSTESITYRVDDTTSGSHAGAYKGSIDFAVPPNTAVLAALDGKVFRVRDDSSKYGETIAFGKDANYITVQHDNGELSEYMHLEKGSALVQVGDYVMTGQQLARTGLSGWLFAPHLHFMVYKKDAEFQCLRVNFID